jgi:diguanylate cyclase (GGDEF)-like protein/PAS domain S-box-containing protein
MSMAQTLAEGIPEQCPDESQRLLFQTLMAHAPLGIWMADAAGKARFVNPTLCEALGISERQFLDAAHYADALPPAAAADCIRADQQLLAQADGRHVSLVWLPFADGKQHLLEITKVKLADRDGASQGLVGLALDITAGKQAESRLQLAASVFTHTGEGIIVTDASGVILEVNDTFTHLTGYSREEALGNNPRMLQSGRQDPEFYAAMWRELTTTGRWYGEIWNRRKNGEVYAEMSTICAVRDADGVIQNYVALFTDITPIKEHQRQLEHIAHYDTLTNLPNRVLLVDRLQQAMARCQRQNRSLAVVYIDLDNFKAVNDRYGHVVGDDLLVVIADRLREALRDGDNLARIGSDEFVVVLTDLKHAQDCEPVLARLLQAASDPVPVRGDLLSVSASIGVTLYPQDLADADQLIRHADQAMYLSKQAGKSRYHLFDIAEDVAMKTQRESLEQIRGALDRREFVLYYQPKVNMKTGEVVGAEALIRWQHPQRGLLAPALFLPIIENHPISVELGEWVIDTALSQMSAWHTGGLVLPVSVNLGARQLQQAGFAERLAQLLAAHPALPAGSLELEILETSALEDIRQVSGVMHACRALGVHFALDDFGTGYSSLTYLKHLPAELLKIDQSFVRDMLDDPDDLAIVEAVIGLATAFRRNVIAEGVETITHGEMLLTLGCELAQGYGIARPMPAAALPGWVASWRPDPLWSAWRERPVNRDDLALVFAEVALRHWTHTLEAYLTGKREQAPAMDPHDCHFGRWQNTGGRVRYGRHPTFPTLVALHQRIHTLGGELIALRKDGAAQAAVEAGIAQLHGLTIELAMTLHELMRVER